MSEDLDALLLRLRDLPDDRAVAEADAFFRSLPVEQAIALAESRPEQVGPLEGAPPELRYRANHL